MNQQEAKPIEASLSALILSIGSSAALAMGLAPHPQTGKTSIDRKLARFNIDLLQVLQQKTRSNLTQDETRLIDSLLQDLQLKFINLK